MVNVTSNLRSEDNNLQNGIWLVYKFILNDTSYFLYPVIAHQYLFDRHIGWKTDELFYRSRSIVIAYYLLSLIIVDWKKNIVDINNYLSIIDTTIVDNQLSYLLITYRLLSLSEKPFVNTIHHRFRVEKTLLRRFACGHFLLSSLPWGPLGVPPKTAMDAILASGQSNCGNVNSCQYWSNDGCELVLT